MSTYKVVVAGVLERAGITQHTEKAYVDIRQQHVLVVD
jgi:hypothetical protein